MFGTKYEKVVIWIFLYLLFVGTQLLFFFFFFFRVFVFRNMIGSLKVSGVWDVQLDA